MVLLQLVVVAAADALLRRRGTAGRSAKIGRSVGEQPLLATATTTAPRYQTCCAA